MGRTAGWTGPQAPSPGPVQRCFLSFAARLREALRRTKPQDHGPYVDQVRTGQPSPYRKHRYRSRLGANLPQRPLHRAERRQHHSQLAVRDRPDPGRGGNAGALHHQCGGEVYRRTGRQSGQWPARGDEGDLGGSPRRQRCCDLPHPTEETLAGVPARAGAPALPHQHLQRGLPHAAPGELRHPRVLRPERLQLLPRTDHHGERCRRCGRDVPRERARCEEATIERSRRGGLQGGFLRT